MYLNKTSNDSIANFSAYVDYDCLTACFFMTLEDIREFLKLLSNNFKNKIINLNSIKLLTNDSTKDGFPIEKIVINRGFKNIDIRMIVNVNKKNKTLYMHCSEDCLIDFKDSLSCLQEDLEIGKSEDISMMVEEWGGDELLNKKIDKDSEVVCHLRLYGII